MKYILILLVMLGCAQKGNKEYTPYPANLTALSQEYREMYAPGPSGFILTDKCDSLLFSSLLGAAGLPVEVKAAELSPGQWLRRPTSLPECYEAGESRSTISRDMLLGVMVWAWEKKDLQTMLSLWEYGKANSWVMGEGRLGGADTYFSPLYQGTLAQLIFRLGGFDDDRRHLPWTATSCDGFVCGLGTVHLFLRAQLYGSLPQTAYLFLEDAMRKQPMNPLPRALIPGQYGAIGELLQLGPWPSGRLPTSKDSCSPWPMHNGDFDLCPDREETHGGWDVIFLDYMMRTLGGA